MTKKLLLCCSIVLGFSAFALGGAITTVGDAVGTPLNVVGITGFVTTGADMDGLSVTAIFAQGGSRTCSWADTGADSGGCSSASFFDIAEQGDTFVTTGDENWTLRNLSTFDSILTLILNGAPRRLTGSGTVFDRTFGGAFGTDGSALGRDIEGTAPGAVTGDGTYSNVVSVGGDPAVGDVFTTLTIAFSNGGLAPGATATWSADTDTIGLGGGRGDVPEPGTISLFLLGAAGLALGRKLKATAGLGRE